MCNIDSNKLQTKQILTMLNALLADDLSDISLTDESEDEDSSKACDERKNLSLNKKEVLETKTLPPPLDHVSSVANSACAATVAKKGNEFKIISDQNIVNDRTSLAIKSKCLTDNDGILREPPVLRQPYYAENTATSSEKVAVAVSSSCSLEENESKYVGKHIAHAANADVGAKTTEADIDRGGNLKLQNINPVSKRALSEKESRLFDIPKRLTKAHR